MELDIPRGTLCSHVEASSLLSSNAEHLLTVSFANRCFACFRQGVFSRARVFGFDEGCGKRRRNLCARCFAQAGRRNSDTSQKRVRPDSRLWTELLDCGTQPLGERLFDGTLPLKRSDFEFLRFEIPTIHLSDGLLPRAVRILIGTAKHWN